MSVYFRNTTRRHRVNAGRLCAAARTLLAETGNSGAELSLSLVGDAAIRRMNREHRGKDKTTDVLSFPLSEAGAFEHGLLGDVVISLDTAERQAAAYDATLDAEIRRLLIHGVLHLLGHDHERPRDAARMRVEERRLADAIGLPWPY